MSEKKTVLEIQGSAGSGGSERHTFILARYLKQFPEWDVIVVLPRAQSPLKQEFDTNEVHYIEMNMKIGCFSAFRSIIRLVRLVRKREIDLIHTHVRNADFLGMLVGLLTKIPVVVTLHGDPSFLGGREEGFIEHSIRKLYSHFLRRLPAKIIVISNYVKETSIETLGLEEDSIDVIYNCSDPERFEIDEDPNERKRVLGIPPKNKVVAQIGLGIRLKRSDLFIRVAQKILEEHTNVSFLMIGQYDDKISRMVNSMELDESKLILTGPTQDIAKILAVVDVLLHTSFREGFGRVITEAMISQKPVVAFRSGGPNEIIAHGETGYLADNLQEMIDYTRKLLNNEEKAKEMGQKGRLRALERFSPDPFIKKHLILFDKLLS